MLQTIRTSSVLGFSEEQYIHKITTNRIYGLEDEDEKLCILYLIRILMRKMVFEFFFSQISLVW